MRYLCGGLAVLLLILAVVWFGWLDARPERVPLSPQDHLRILKVSLGTNHVFSLEPVWKRAVRSVWPKWVKLPLGPAEEWRATTAHSTLVLWVDEADAAGYRHASRFDQPVAILEEDVVASARTVELPNRIVRLELTSFARDLEDVPLQVRFGTGTVRFAVRNPQRIVRPAWADSSLGSTNRSRGVELSMRPAPVSSSGRAATRREAIIRTKSNPSPGWWSWRATVFDDLGNWSATEVQHSSRLRLPMLPRTNAPQRLSLEGWEYISAGFLNANAVTRAMALRASERAAAHGVRALVYFGVGDYAVTNGMVIPEPARRTPGHATQEFAAGPGTNWSGRFHVASPSVLCLSELDRGQTPPRVRARERLPANGGRIFSSSTWWGVTNVIGVRTRLATMTAVRIPGTTTNLEVEIIGALPPLSFSMP